jgi:hypothetical protein
MMETRFFVAHISMATNLDSTTLRSILHSALHKQAEAGTLSVTIHPGRSPEEQPEIQFLEVETTPTEVKEGVVWRSEHGATFVQALGGEWQISFDNPTLSILIKDCNPVELEMIYFNIKHDKDVPPSLLEAFESRIIG